MCVPTLKEYESRPTLRVLDISDNKIENVDVKIYPYLQQVRFLNCSYNRLTSISYIIGHNDNKTKPLEEIHCSNNLIMTIPTTIGLVLPNITIFDISHNQLQTIPVDITNLTRLKLLDVSYNKIKFIDSHTTNLFNQFNTEVMKESINGF